MLTTAKYSKSYKVKVSFPNEEMISKLLTDTILRKQINEIIEQDHPLEKIICWKYAKSLKASMKLLHFYACNCELVFIDKRLLSKSSPTQNLQVVFYHTSLSLCENLNVKEINFKL